MHLRAYQDGQERQKELVENLQNEVCLFLLLLLLLLLPLLLFLLSLLPISILLPLRLKPNKTLVPPPPLFVLLLLLLLLPLLLASFPGSHAREREH